MAVCALNRRRLERLLVAGGSLAAQHTGNCAQTGAGAFNLRRPAGMWRPQSPRFRAVQVDICSSAHDIQHWIPHAGFYRRRAKSAAAS